MPKASGPHVSVAGQPVPSVLKRNQACHQCRRRKLKCDAQRPCATCIRSHQNTINTALPGAPVPAEPECTYDDVPEPRSDSDRATADGGIRSKYERLESRIMELESQLKEKDRLARFATSQLRLQSLPRTTNIMQQHHQSLLHQEPLNMQLDLTLAGIPMNMDPSPSTGAHDDGSASYITPITPFTSNQSSHFSSNHHIDDNAPNSAFPYIAMGLTSPFAIDPAAMMADTGMNAGSANIPGLSPEDANLFTNTLLWNSWPPRLPALPLLTHLCEIFFASHPHAHRLLHRPTFMASLTLSPSNPNFPALSLLHAICAIASLWSSAVEQENMPDLTNRPADEFFQEAERRKIREQRASGGLGAQGDSSGTGRGEYFGEMHAKWSREEEERGAAEGVGVFQGLQSIVILTWYFYMHARWVEVWLYTSKAMRYAVPMGLNTTPTHGPLLRSWTMPSILGPPRDIVEMEMRRNTFWLCYCYERWQAASTGWAMSLDDEDISQVLSARLNDFENGVKVPIEHRQRISTPRVLTLHLPEQTDSFTLYIKGTILFSKVKNFNIRFKSKYYYAVASSTANGDRFGPPPPSRMFANYPMPDDVPGIFTTSPTGSSTANTKMHGENLHTNGPSPDRTPLTTLATSTVLQDDTLTSTTRFHALSSPAFPPATTGNPLPGPAGTYSSATNQAPERIDPRDTPSFRAVDGLIEGFRTSFPKDLRDPVRGGTVDSELYVACLVPHVATILLHDPHADPSAPECKSAEKLLCSARAILDLVYIVCSTSFDITLLDPVASFAWFLAARVFVRFIKAKLEMGQHADAIGLRNELEMIRLALRRMGERIPLGFRQSRMLDDLLTNEVGTALDESNLQSFTSPTEDSTGPLPSATPTPNLSHRGSFSGPSSSGPMPNMGPRRSLSGQGQPSAVPQLGHRGSLSGGSLGLPGNPNHHGAFSGQGQPMRSQRGSLSGQGEPSNATSLDNLPGRGLSPSGRTKGLSVSELFKLSGGMVTPVGLNPSPTPSHNHLSAGGVDAATQTAAAAAADVHQHFMDSLDPNKADLGMRNVQGPGLEMLLIEMVEDGDTDSGFANVTGMPSLGAMPVNGPSAPGVGGLGMGFGSNEFSAGGIGVMNWT